jgi:N-methylhydantoinase A
LLNLGVDTGGTFTDFVVWDESDKSVRVSKVPSTPDEPSAAFLEGVECLEIDLADVRRIVHGTTLATNAILERKGARVGALVTEGHRDVLEFGQLRRYGPAGAGLWDRHWTRPEPYVPRRQRHEVRERILASGAVRTPLDREAVARAARRMSEDGVESIAVCFLHSYANAEHELAAAEVLARELPEIPVSLSVETVPEYREFERWSTTMLNAYVSPLLRVYLARLSAELRGRGFDGELFYMTSAGGILTERTAPEYPVRFLLSGPAAGVSAGTFFAERSSVTNIITYDMGGTSTDVSLVKQLTPILTHERTFEGTPVKTPQLDILTIGAGAGSIAWVGPEGGLRVGPESAGADPGPVCYGRGGTRPTVTDANLVLGRLGTESMVGGAMHLDAKASERAIEEFVRGLTGLGSVAEVAEAIVTVCVSNMAGAIRTVSVERGYDPRDFALLALGGAGPMHVAAIADELGVERCLVPLNPGNGCAFGLLTTDLAHDYVETHVTNLREADLSVVRRAWQTMEEQGREALAQEGLGAEQTRIGLSADLRYVGQSWQLNVPLMFEAPIDDIAEAFHRVYEETYGYSRPEMEVELVALRAVASGLVERPELSVDKAGAEPEPVEPASRRLVTFRGEERDCPVYERSSLSVGARVSGPAVVEEYGSATILLPGWTGTPDPTGNLILEVDR